MPFDQTKAKKLAVPVFLVLAAAAVGLWVAKDRVPAIQSALASITGPAAPTGSTAATAAANTPAQAAASSATNAPASSATTSAPAQNPAPAPVPAPAAKAPTVSGALTAVAGDALSVSVTLKGISAPHPGDTCANSQGKEEDIGIQARTAQGMLIGTSPVSCTIDPDGAVCTLPDGTELNARIVELGWAIGRTGTPYEGLTDAAKTAKRGLWGACPELGKK